MTTNHTEGPWAVSPENPKIIKPADQFGMASNVIIGSAAGHPNSGFFPTDEEAIANARLIAAAPELLEALSVLYAVAAEQLGDDWAAVTNAAAVIAKARGAQ